VFLGHEQKQNTLLELFDSHNEERKKQVGVNVTQSTYQQYILTRQYIAEFLTCKYCISDIPVMEINREFIVDFETYLIQQYDLSRNYVGNLSKKFRHIINLALDKEIIYKNPFKEHKFQREKTDRGFLLQSEIEALIDHQFEEERLEKTRDLFIFCAFTGLAFMDAKNLTNENIQTSIDDNLWIKGKRKKTDTEFNIPLLNIPKTILEKYKGKASGDLLLPFGSHQRFNICLKKVAKLCGIKKNVTSHLARHTFATFALTNGVSIECVSKILGHTKINTTQIYARVIDKKIRNEMNEFAGKLRYLDAKLLNFNEINIDDVLKSVKISTSETVWKTLSVKIWLKMANFERHSFVLVMNSNENNPKTIRDFYIVLMNYFLDNLKTENANDTEIRLAVNF